MIETVQRERQGFPLPPGTITRLARIPKCANTSIKTRLSSLIATKTSQHPRQNRILEPTNDLFWKKCTKQARWLKPDQYTDLYDSVTSFTVIRDPLSRLQSCYREKVLRSEVFPSMKRLGYHNQMSFEDFVEFTCSLALCEMDVHTKPQTFLIMDSKGRLPHFIARLENLDQDWNTFSNLMLHRKVNLGGALPRLNQSQTTSESRCSNSSLSPTVQRHYELTYGPDIKLFETTAGSQTEA